MDTNLKGLQIDRSQRRGNGSSRRTNRWIVVGVLLIVLVGAASLAFKAINASTEVETVRAAKDVSGGDPVALNATGYIVAHHEIQVASKVVGRVSWIGVEKGDAVKEGQVLVRLEDEEYRAQLRQAQGQLTSLEAKLAEAQHGSRPEEIDQAKANLEQAQADLANNKATLDRTTGLAAQGVLSKQALDDAQLRYEAQAARVASLNKAYELVRKGPRQENIDSLKGQVEQATGAVEFAQTQLANTVIRAPVTGTILVRGVEKGEFVTNGFVGDKGAKGYVVTLADLNDLQVELDIAQNDFAKLRMGQKGIVNTDAFPDRKYDGEIVEISPEADRQKATVQVKVKILHPDSYLRPEMNASVAFISGEKPATASGAEPAITAPQSAVHDNAVFVVLGGRAARRSVKVAATTAGNVQVREGLMGGEQVIVNPPAGLKDGDRVRVRGE
jgi:HlyD family secretion protein